MYPTSDSRKGRVGVTVPLMRGNHGIQLRVIAAKTARDMQERVEPLKDEIRHTGERKIAAETELGLVNSAGGRVDSYDAEALHCPECWVKREHQAQLTYISPAANGERFGCDTCGSEFVV